MPREDVGRQGPRHTPVRSHRGLVQGGDQGCSSLHGLLHPERQIADGVGLDDKLPVAELLDQDGLEERLVRMRNRNERESPQA